MSSYDDLMKFLDLAIRETKKHALDLHSLDEKTVYIRHARNLQDARNALLKEYYTFEDYIATGKYNVPEIKFTMISTPIKTV